MILVEICRHSCRNVDQQLKCIRHKLQSMGSSLRNRLSIRHLTTCASTSLPFSLYSFMLQSSSLNERRRGSFPASYFWRVTPPHKGVASYLFGTIHLPWLFPHLPLNIKEATQVNDGLAWSGELETIDKPTELGQDHDL